jgi:hypothetical protein
MDVSQRRQLFSSEPDGDDDSESSDYLLSARRPPPESSCIVQTPFDPTEPLSVAEALDFIGYGAFQVGVKRLHIFPIIVGSRFRRSGG